jgi:hypothetical protein
LSKKPKSRIAVTSFALLLIFGGSLIFLGKTELRSNDYPDGAEGSTIVQGSSSFVGIIRSGSDPLGSFNNRVADLEGEESLTQEDSRKLQHLIDQVVK